MKVTKIFNFIFCFFHFFHLFEQDNNSKQLNHFHKLIVNGNSKNLILLHFRHGCTIFKRNNTFYSFWLWWTMRGFSLKGQF